MSFLAAATKKPVLMDLTVGNRKPWTTVGGPPKGNNDKGAQSQVPKDGENKQEHAEGSRLYSSVQRAQRKVAENNKNKKLGDELEMVGSAGMFQLHGKGLPSYDFSCKVRRALEKQLGIAQNSVAHYQIGVRGRREGPVDETVEQDIFMVLVGRDNQTAEALGKLAASKGAIKIGGLGGEEGRIYEFICFPYHTQSQLQCVFTLEAQEFKAVERKMTLTEEGIRRALKAMGFTCDCAVLRIKTNDGSFYAIVLPEGVMLNKKSLDRLSGRRVPIEQVNGDTAYVHLCTKIVSSAAVRAARPVMGDSGTSQPPSPAPFSVETVSITIESVSVETVSVTMETELVETVRVATSVPIEDPSVPVEALMASVQVVQEVVTQDYKAQMAALEAQMEQLREQQRMAEEQERRNKDDEAERVRKEEEAAVPRAPARLPSPKATKNSSKAVKKKKATEAVSAPGSPATAARSKAISTPSTPAAPAAGVVEERLERSPVASSQDEPEPKRQNMGGNLQISSASGGAGGAEGPVNSREEE